MDTKEHIKEVARGLFAQHGFDGVSIRDIIEKAEVNLGAITYHFGGKEELFRELIMDMAMALSSELQHIDSLQTTATKKLEAFMRAYMKLLLRNPTKSRMIIMQMVLGNKEFLEIIGPYAKGNLGILKKVLEEGMKNGEFRKMDPQLAAFSIFGVNAHFITVQPLMLQFLEKENYDDEFIEKAVNHTVQFVLGTLINDGGGK
jgi:AcrR family transcriptional regulator